MKKLFKYSEFLHWMTFLCLCLPFFYTGCRKAEAATEEEVRVDTTSIDPESANTVKIDSIAIKKQQDSIAEEKPNVEEKEETFSETVSRENTFLKPILVSKEKRFSGLAMLIDSGISIFYFSICVYFLLSIISLTTKYLESNAIKTIVLLDVLALLFLIISLPVTIFYERLWGSWVTIILFSTVTIIDIYILKKHRQ